MRVTMLAKDEDSKKNGCPSVYLGADGSAVVPGPEVDAGTLGNLAHLLPGETAVHIKPSVLRAAVAAYLERG
ncbi:MAG: hypothetical protein H0V92_12170 [Pseudonocardiales bacterium]|nr:hypothetical protein [Pseudonocardiales bacterium]